MIIGCCGCDASGKQTQTKILAERMGAERIAFPDYTTQTGKDILSLLKEEWGCWGESERGMGTIGKSTELNARVLQCLMTVNRFELLSTINGYVAAGKDIVFDRYYASAIVYGTLDGLDRAWIESIQASLPEPDLWILLDVSPEESIKRRPDRRDRYEKTPGFQEKVRDGYLKLFAEKKKNVGIWHVVDGVGTVEEVSQRIWDIVEPRVLTKAAKAIKIKKSKRTAFARSTLVCSHCTNPANFAVEGIDGAFCFEHLPPE